MIHWKHVKYNGILWQQLGIKSHEMIYVTNGKMKRTLGTIEMIVHIRAVTVAMFGIPMG